MSKQTAVEYITQGLEKLRHKFDQDTFLTLQCLIIGAKQKEKEQMKEYADYAIKQLHETGICFYDEYGNLEDVKGGEE
jgi:wyosine [tRNA(Phe)-imidazoG37] synthetase (radical SAM superfamily)